MPRDAELGRLIDERDAIQRAIDEIVDENTTGGSFLDFSIRRNTLADLNRQRDRVNYRIRVRQGHLLDMPSPIWGSVVRTTRQMPPAYDREEPESPIR